MSECNCTTPECTCGGTGSVIVKIDHDPVVKILKKRISDLEAANAKQATRIAELEDEREKLEPVAYRERITGRLADADDEHRTRFHMAYDALYARPVPARTLTDDKIFELDAQHLWIESDVVCGRVGFARAIEAWLKGGE